MIFVETNGKLSPVRVRVDLISGISAAVTPLRGTLDAGSNVVIASGSASSAKASSGTHSPAGGAGGPGGMGSIGRALH